MLSAIAAVFLILATTTDLAHANPATVIDVYDGDTLDVHMQGKKVKIRLYGIDAPESGQHGNVSAGRFLRHLVDKHPLRITVIATGRFDQTLAIVIREGKEASVNAAMVANGYAWVNPDKCTTDACNRWKQLESQARRLRLGIWSGYDLVPPWEFGERNGR